MDMTRDRCVALSIAGGWIASRAEEALQQMDRWLLSDRRRALLLLCVLMLAYMVAWDGITFLRHYYFHTTYDLTFYDHVAWNTAHGRVYASSIEVRNMLGDHVNLFLAALSLLYWLVSSPYVLLAAQSCILALCAWPVYRLARRRLGSPAMALVVAACALLYPPLGFINRFDFHPEVFALPILLAAYERLDADDLRGAALWMGLALLAKEDIGFTVAALGLFAAAAHKRYRFGLTWAAVGTAYSLFAILIIIPAFRGAPSDTLARYAWLGNTPAAMLNTLLSQPLLVLQKLITAPHLLTLLQLLAPLAFLPLAGLLALLPGMPALVYNLLSEWASQGTIYYQYMIPTIPFMYVAVVYALQRLTSGHPRASPPHPSLAAPPAPRRKMAFLLTTMLLATLASWVYENPITGHTVIESGIVLQARTGDADRVVSRRGSLILPNNAAVREGLKHVPAEAHVVTTNNYAPHLAHRHNIGIFPNGREAIVSRHAEVIFLNLSDRRGRLSCDDYRDYVELAVQAGFGVTFYRDRVLLAQRGGGDRQQLRELADNWPGCE